MDLVLLYSSQLKQLRVMSDRLKQRLLAQCPDMKAHNHWRNMLFVFDGDMGRYGL